MKGLTRAARRWLLAAVEAYPAPIHPTFGPYQQLRTAGLLEAPQHAATLTPSRLAEVRAWAAEQMESSR